jgi:serine/threonine protein kinase
MTDTPATDQHEDAQASNADSGPPSLVGEVISGRYRIEAELGVGGMGAVYRAEHTLMRKRVAVKVLHPEMTRLPEVVARFEREAMAAAHIEHPNVAAATDFGKLDDGSFFLVLEFVEGVSLRDLIHEGPLPPQRAVHIARQVAAALVRAHGLGIVHRDLKPENVMLVERDGDKDFAKVLDFGIAKVPVAQFEKREGDRHKTLTRVGMVYGTPEYMAPEQALGQEVDARADLYALGIMLYEMLAGRRPFESDNPVTLLGMQVTKAPPPFDEINPDLHIPPDLEALVMELIEKEAARRPTDARQVLDALEQLEATMRRGMPSSTVIRAVQPAVADAVTHPALEPPDVSRQAAPRTGTWSDLRRAITPLVDLARDGLRRIDLAQVRARLDSVHKTLPAPMRAVPAMAWVAALVALPMLLVLSGVTLFCLTRHPASPSTSGAPIEPVASVASAAPSASAPAVETLDDAMLSEALGKGPEALESLATRFPDDPRPIKLLGRYYMAQLQPTKALDAYRRLFKVDPKMRSDSEVQQNIVLAATRTESEDYAFQVMEREMGAQGVDLLYSIGYEGKGKSSKVASRAQRSLKAPAVRKMASKAALIALDMRAAGGCEAKYKLLERARDDGDERTAVQLRALLATNGCGFLGLGDCWKCMRRSSRLSEALKAIDARSNNP